MDQETRLRFAPSPTGNLHIGGARTALFNWAYAKRTGGTFVLRIEDTDRERSTPAYEQAILDGLRWLGIDWDEGPDVGGDHGPYHQTERLERHRAAAERLLAEGHAYRCFCSPERLAKLREEGAQGSHSRAYDGRCRELTAGEVEARLAADEPFVVRFRVPEGETRLVDLIRGNVKFENADVDDWIMVRADGSPTYNFVVVCDDSDMRITHVVRGEEHLTNTPKQLLLYAALGLEPPSFAHLPLMLGKDKKKLSKRTGDTSLLDYRDKGYPPEAVLNFLCLQGWALDGEREVFDVGELVANFEPRDVSKAGAIFDPEKFLWMAGEYVRLDTLERVADRCAPFVAAAGLMDEARLAERREWFLAAVASEKERIRVYADLPERIAYLFAEDEALPFDEAAVKNAKKHESFAGTLAAYASWLGPRLADGVEPDALRQETRAWIDERGLKIPALFQPLRTVLTGAPKGVDLFDAMALLGAASTLRRIEHGARRLGEA